VLTSTTTSGSQFTVTLPITGDHAVPQLNPTL
jgi:hypothetical protein